MLKYLTGQISDGQTFICFHSRFDGFSMVSDVFCRLDLYNTTATKHGVFFLAICELKQKL